MRGRILIAFLIGCGGSGLDIDADQDNVCGEIARVACHNLYQCCSEGEIEAFLDVSDPRTELECQADVGRRCVRAIATLDFSIDEKRARFDGSRMNRCLDSLVAPTGTCATVATELPWTEACADSAWIGLVGDGAECLQSFECASKDSFCGASQTCIAKPVEGQECGIAGCATGLYCNAGICRTQLAAGAVCSSSVQCQMNLFCDFGGAPSVCAPLRQPGEPCTGNASCVSAQCNPGTCMGTTQTCFTDSQCSGRCADDGSTCFNDGNCAVGQCSISANACTSPTQCTGVGETCIFPVKCNPGDCVGSIVCADRHFIVDYCEAALGALPFPE